MKKLRALFWNVAGLENKGQDFWEHIRRFEYVSMSETWVEEKVWEKMLNRMPGEFRWRAQFARRDAKKGRAKSGIVTGVRREIEEIEQEGVNSERVQERRLRIQNNVWRVLSVYCNGEMKQMTSEIMNGVNEPARKGC